jgi:hypothetical protein
MAAAARLEEHEAIDYGKQNDGEERADVDQGEDLAEMPRQPQPKQESEGEEDVAPDDIGGTLGPGGNG